MIRLLALLLLAAASLAAGPARADIAADIAGAARVIDGDTLEVAGQVVRLDGIDAPESGQRCRDGAGRDWPCGRDAARALAGWAAGGVRCAGSARDDYGRLIAVCAGAGGEINARLVRDGWALAFRRYSLRYVAEEDAARSAGAGIWAGSFTAPWDFRAGRWESAAADAPLAGCPIKGNISANGRIYHTPYSRDYDRTRIDTARGERWFCSEAEALAAGWRAPRG